MLTVRTIGTSLDQGYREDLNYNFKILASQINGSSELFDSTKKELLDMIDNLQQQILAITDTDWSDLSEHLTKAINDSLEALIKVNEATINVEKANEEAVESIGIMNDIINNFSFDGEYNDSQEYRKYNNVYFEGSSYFYINDIPSKGNRPPNFPVISNEYWRMSASKGANGDGGVSKVNEKEPDGTGNINLTPEDIDAVSQLEFEEHVSAENDNAHKVKNIEGLQDEFNLKANKKQMERIALPLISGFENIVGELSFYKDDFDVVYVYGVIRTPRSGTLNVTTMPENYRPKNNYYTSAIASADDQIRTATVNYNTGALSINRVEANKIYVVDCYYRMG